MSRDKTYLRHILDAIARIDQYTAVGNEPSLAEPMRQDAVIRQLEIIIIGEATKNLSADLRSRHSDIPWRRSAGLRDVLIHNYPGIELDIVWDVTQQELPELRRNLEAILDEETRS